MSEAAIITHHALHRCRKRFGLPTKAVKRAADIALRDGVPREQFSGRFRRYLDGVFMQECTAGEMRVYGDRLFIFDGRLLLTAWQLPGNYRRLLQREGAL